MSDTAMIDHRFTPDDIPTDPDRLQRSPLYMGPIVDAHTHLFPENLFRAIREWFRNVQWNVPYPYRTKEVVDLLRGWNVAENWALVYAHKAGVADGLNRWMGETQKKHPGVRGFATLHPEDDDPAADLIRALDEYGLVGLKLHCEVQRIHLDDARLDRALAIAQERRIPCMLHVGDAPYPDPPTYLSASLFAGRMRRQPKLVAVIAHLGTTQTERFLRIMDRYPSVHLETSFTRFPGFPGAPPLDPAILAPYAERVLFGSDFPNITFTYADQVDAWWEVDWVRAGPEAFFAGNARRLIGGAE